MDAIHTLVPRALPLLFKRGPLSQGKLEVAWRVAVGDAISRAATVRLQAEGVVDVHPVDQRWRKELKRSSSVIHSRLEALLGAGTIGRLVVK